MNNFLKYTLFVAACIFYIVACSDASNKPVTIITNEPTNLNAIQTELPAAPGYETFKMNCISCHSARYIQMQPDLPEKTWTAIVGKMQKSFGAPIADSSAKQIVQYLVAIKGKK